MVAARHGWHHPAHRGAWWTVVPGLAAPAARAVASRPAAMLVAACALVSGSVLQVTVHQIAEDNAHRAAVAAAAAAEQAAQEHRARVDSAATTRLSGAATAYLAHRRSLARESAVRAVQTADALTATPPDLVAPEDLAELSAAMIELNSLLADTPDADVALSLAAEEVARTAPDDGPTSEPVEVDTAQVLSITPLQDAVELLEDAAQSAESAAPAPDDAAGTVERSVATSRTTTGPQRADATADTVGAASARSASAVPAAPGPVAPTASTFTGSPVAAADGLGSTAPATAAEAIDPTNLLTPDLATSSRDVLREGLPAESLLAVADLDLGDSERLEAAADRVLELSAQLQAAVDDALAKQRAEQEALAKAAASAQAKADRLARLVAAADAAPNGEIPAKYLCSVDFDRTVQLRCDAAGALEKLNRAYRAASGHNLRVSSSYRTADQQAVLHEEKGDLAATAGTSNHGRGQAIDLAGAGSLGQFDAPLYLWLTQHAAEFGWHHPSYMEPDGPGPLEPWHWEYGTED